MFVIEPEHVDGAWMVRTIAVATAACCAALAAGAGPADAMTGDGRIGVAPQAFGIPGVYGISAWGSYARTDAKVRVTVCVRDTARDVYGGEAAGVASDGGYARHQVLSTVVIGYGRTACTTMTTAYTGHLVVDALSGYRNGKVRQAGKLRRVY